MNIASIAGPAPTAHPQRAPHALNGVTIVLPCFNEADNVAAAVRQATIAAEYCAQRHEIVVVDDGSSDETAAIAASLAARDPRVRLVMHAGNRGYGAAVRSGIAAAKMPWLLLTDADLQFDLGELEGFLEPARTADLIMGRRIDRQDPLYRKMNAHGWNWLMRRLFDIPVHDVDCAFKLVRTPLAQNAGLTAGGAMVSTELVVRCVAAGARLQERGVQHRPRVAGEPTGADLRVIVRAFKELAGLRRSLQTVVATGARPGRSQTAAI